MNHNLNALFYENNIKLKYHVITKKHVDMLDQNLSEWLLLNANSAIFQLYHGENKLIFVEQQMPILVFGSTRSGLKPTIYRTRGENTNDYTTDVVNQNLNICLNCCGVTNRLE